MSWILPLELNDVTFSANSTPLLHGITHAFDTGPLSLIIGPNGAGKSLLLRLCHGLLHPTSGTIAWRGEAADQAAHHQALVFQKPVLLRRSISENIAYPLQISARLDKREVAERVEQALTLAGLNDIAERSANVISGGEQQKLALARAHAQRPEVLFLDEPTANLDPRSLKDVEALITSMHEAGTKIIMTSHDMGQVKRLADEIVFLYDGRIMEAGAAGPFLRKPKSRQAAAFVKGELIE